MINKQVVKEIKSVIDVSDSSLVAAEKIIQTYLLPLYEQKCMLEGKNVKQQQTIDKLQTASVVNRNKDKLYFYR